MEEDHEEEPALEVARQVMRSLYNNPTRLGLMRAFWWIGKLSPDERAVLTDDFHPEAEWRMKQRESTR